MRKIASLFLLLIVSTWCLPNSFAQRRKPKRDAVFIGGGASTGAIVGRRHQRRRHSRRMGTTTRGVVEREQLEFRKHRRRH